MKNRFQLKRFGHLMTWTLYGQKSELLTTFVAMVAMYFIVMGITIWSQKDSPAWAQQASYNNVTGFWVIMTGIASFVLSTRLFLNLKTKEKRITYLTLPASTVEKYLARLLYVCVVLPLLLPFAFVTADLLATAFGQALGVDYAMESCAYIGTLFQQTTPQIGTTEEATLIVAMAYFLWALSLAVDALVLLCSTVFRHALLVSIACVFAVVFAVLYTVSGTSLLGISPEEGKLACVLLGTLFLLVALLELWLSYRVFRRMEVVPGRFTNL